MTGTVETNGIYHTGQILYRAEASVHYGKAEITFEVFEVFKVTPKGAWIGQRTLAGQEIFRKWIGNSTYYTHTSKEAALGSLHVRKRRHATCRLEDAQVALAAVEVCRGVPPEPVTLRKLSGIFSHLGQTLPRASSRNEPKPPAEGAPKGRDHDD